MDTGYNDIDRLQARLDELEKKQQGFSAEISALQHEINALRLMDDATAGPELPATVEDLTSPAMVEPVAESPNPFTPYPPIETPAPVSSPIMQETALPDRPGANKPFSKMPKGKSDLEKFIGENLISKIGIAITIIGVAIGAKYSIEHNLISPLTRIILGYLVGLGLLGFGIKLKAKYENYSSVLVSGAMAIMFLITYLAYDLYALIPQALTFGLMVMFMAFTVVAAINYNRQVIAHIGLVGAYAVPFMLSDGSGRVGILFTYMTIINIGILIIAVKRYWKSLYYASFGLTWLIYASWFAFEYRMDMHYSLALVFLCVFFATFYTIFLAYKLLQEEKFGRMDIVLLLLNSTLFYGLGYAIISDHEVDTVLPGLFTLGNAIIHFIVGNVIYRRKLADKNMFYLVIGMVLVFITITIPVMLSGNWVTLLWSCEAALLFWIGKSRKVRVYQLLSYPLMLLAFFSLLQDWQLSANAYIPGYSLAPAKIIPVFNTSFLVSMLFVAAFSIITYVNYTPKYKPEEGEAGEQANNTIISLMNFVIPTILVFVLYYAFALEISRYWDQLYYASMITIKDASGTYPQSFMNEDLGHFKTVWLINYTLLFCMLMSLLNMKKIQSKNLAIVNIVLNILSQFAFLTVGLYALSELRDSYLAKEAVKHYNKNAFYIGIRYITYLFAAGMLTTIYHYIRTEFFNELTARKTMFEFLVHTVILWVASSEYITLMDMMRSAQSYKLGLSILWGVYALLLIVLGIWKNNKPLRIAAIVLFGITLLKLFLYDISHLNTIAKTIVFVSLGVLLLIVSFLYNKYKHKISGEEEH